MANEAPATKADIENLVLLIQQTTERFERRFDALDRRFDAVDGRFEAIENRLDRMNVALASLQGQMAAFTRVTRLEQGKQN